MRINAIEWMGKYRDDLVTGLGKVDITSIAMAAEMIKSTTGRVWVCGNGGSQAIADHMVVDLLKLCGVRAMGLTGIPTLTALANDLDYGQVYSAQLERLLDPEDLVIVFSGSGKSENVLNALKVAKAKNTLTIGVTGFDGGEVGKLVDCHVNMPVQHMGLSEDGGMFAMHEIVYYLQSEKCGMCEGV